jgi:hypothetical protein
MLNDKVELSRHEWEGLRDTVLATHVLLQQHVKDDVAWQNHLEAQLMEFDTAIKEGGDYQKAQTTRGKLLIGMVSFLGGAIAIGATLLSFTK